MIDMVQNNYDNLNNANKREQSSSLEIPSGSILGEANGVGKRMPYNVPDDFFAALEEKVIQVVKADTPQSAAPPQRKVWLSKGFRRLSIAAAAALAVVVGYHALSRSQSEDGFTAVEEAFAHLSEEDQEYLLEVYQEDIFMEEDADVLDI